MSPLLWIRRWAAQALTWIAGEELFSAFEQAEEPDPGPISARLRIENGVLLIERDDLIDYSDDEEDDDPTEVPSPGPASGLVHMAPSAIMTPSNNLADTPAILHRRIWLYIKIGGSPAEPWFEIPLPAGAAFFATHSQVLDMRNVKRCWPNE